MSKLGRPTDYSPELGKRICEALATSTNGLEAVCKPDDLPAPSTVYRWLIRYPDFKEDYVRAREAQTEAMYDEIRQITDAPLVDDNGFPLSGPAAMAEVNKRKLQIDAIKFALTKLQSKRFGERRDVDVNMKVQHQVSAEQFTQLLSAAKSAVVIEANAEEAEYEELPALPSPASDFDTLEDEDDDLG